MIKKLLLSTAFLTTALFSGLNYSIYAQAVNTVELETLNQGQEKNIIPVNSENDLPKDGTTYTLVYSKQHCKLPDEPEKTSEVTTITTEKGVPEVLDKPSIEIPTTASTSIETTATTSTVVPNSVVSTTNSSTTETKNTTTVSKNEASQKKTTESAPQTTTTLTTVLKNQIKQSLPQTGTQKSVTVVLTAGVLVALAFLMIKYHKKKVWMVLLLTASVTSLYNLRNVMAQNETKVTTIPVTTFVPTKEYCLVGYIIIPNTSETTEITTEKGVPEIQSELPEYQVPTTAGTATEATVTTATTTTSTEPTTTTTTSTEATSAEPIFEASEVESTKATTTEPTTTEPTTTEPTTTN